MNRIATATSSRYISAQMTAPVIIRAFDYAGYKDQELQSPPYRSRSLDSLTVMGQECESPLPALAPPSPPCTLAPRMQLLTASHTQLLTPYSGRAKFRTMAKARTIGLVYTVAAEQRR